MEPHNGRLVLDIGNSRTKLGLFHDGRLAAHTTVANGDLTGIAAFLGKRQLDHVVVGSVSYENAELLDGLGRFGPLEVITGGTPSPLRNLYSNPESLGADRWANATGASVLFPGRAVLAIALGTCVICDLVDGEGTYHGGIISPGFSMRARAMGEFTARLPVVAPAEQPVQIGLSTLDSLAAGVHHGLRRELLGTIAWIREQHPDLAVVLTGGDAPRFARALENGIFAHPFLTLFGLDALSLFNRPAAGARSSRPGR